MLQSRRELLDEFLDFVGESGDSVARATAELVLNRALQTLWQKHAWRQFQMPSPYTFPTVPGQRSYAMPEHFGRVRGGRIRNLTTGSEISGIDMSDLESRQPTAGTYLETPGIPQVYMVGGTVGVAAQPGPDSYVGSRYPGLVLQAGPLAYWRFEDGGNIVPDLSGHGVDATWLSMTGVAQVPGVAGSNGISLAGTSDGLQFSSVYLSRNWTMEFWIRPTLVPGAFQALIVDPLTGVGPYITDDGKIGMFGLLNQIHTENPLTDGALYHCVFSTDGNTGHWYVNGIDVSYDPSGGFIFGQPANDFAPSMLFMDAFAEPAFAAMVDEIALYRFAFSLALAQEHYQVGLEPPNPFNQGDLEVLSSDNADFDVRVTLRGLDRNGRDQQLQFTLAGTNPIPLGGWSSVEEFTKSYVQSTTPPTTLTSSRGTVTLRTRAGVVLQTLFADQSAIEHQLVTLWPKPDGVYQMAVPIQRAPRRLLHDADLIPGGWGPALIEEMVAQWRDNRGEGTAAAYPRPCFLDLIALENSDRYGVPSRTRMFMG